MNFDQPSRPEPKAEKMPMSREPESYPDLNKALRLAEKRVFCHAIDPYDFTNPEGRPYSLERVQKDMDYANELEQAFREQNIANANLGARARWEMLMKLGKVFEAIVLFNGDNEWFGKNARVIVPSRYDDIVHGVDGIVEFEGEKNFFSHLALGIDMTVSTDVNRKMKKILQDIDRGELTMMSYFHSERQHFKGEKRNIPRVIVGADRQTMHDLTVTWMKEEGMIADFTKHPMQIQMLDGIVWQLEAFAAYAEKKNKPALVEIYRNDLAIIREVLSEKQEVFGASKVDRMRKIASEDLVYRRIREATAGLA